MSIWQTLGVEETVAVADLRRRYATLIKEFRPETHPQDFARIRQAYEAALPWARRREAQLAEEAAAPGAEAGGEATAPEPATDASAPAAAVDAEDEPLPVVDEPEISDTASTAMRGGGPAGAPDDVPPLATQFRRFQELTEAAAGTRDEALLPALRALLRARASTSLDDSQALEFALMRWFVEAGNPPLTLLFEAGHTFDWHLHPARLSTWLPPWALCQVEARLSLSRDLVWARHFSRNAWLRRLHSPVPALTLVASRPATLEALRWAERWRLSCEDAATPTLARALDARTQRRLQGHALMSTDLLTGLALAFAADTLFEATLYVVIGAVLALALRLGLRWLQPTPGQFRLPGPIARAVAEHLGLGILLMAGLAGLGFAMLAGDAPGGDSRAIALPLIAPAALVGVLAIWHLLAWLELVAAEPFTWRDAVDRLEFDAFLRHRAVPDPEAVFGRRLSTWQRWQAIPAAWQLRKTELATRARPPRRPVFRWIRLALVRPGASRLLWIGAWILFAILRFAHVLGSGH